MSNWKFMIVAGSILLGGCASGIYMQGPSGRGASTVPSLTATATAGISAALSADQIAAVRRWYGESQRQNRGRGRGNGLPPGIARNLARGKLLLVDAATQVVRDVLLDAIYG